MKTVLSKKQIQAYQLVAGEFEGFSTTESAEFMGISVQAFNRLLKRAKKAVPSLFPLLSVQEVDVKALLAIGYNNYDLANQLGVSLNRISQITNSLYAKRPGMVANSQPVKIVRYASHLDSQIVRKF